MSQNHLSRDIVLLDRWSLNQDLTYAFSVRVLLKLLQGCLRSFFHLPIWVDLEEEQTQLAALALTDSEAVSLLILRSQIIALMGRPNHTDPAIWQNTCSLQDVTLISNPVDWLSGLFPLENCTIESFIRFPDLRNLFFSRWSRTCSIPNWGFENNDIGRLLVHALERRTADQRVFFSLSFMLVWFIAFFMRFSAEFALSEENQIAILRVVFRDVFTRLSVFNEADLSSFWFQNAFHLIGSVCVACLPMAWRDRPNLMFQEILLPSGDGMYDFTPLDEARLMSVFRHRFPLPVQYWHAHSMFYGEEGRTLTFLSFFGEAITGHLETSLVWSTWREVSLPVFSSLFPEVNSRRPGSLSSYVSRSIIANIHNGHLSVPPALFLHILNQVNFFSIEEGTSLGLRCLNLRNHARMLPSISSGMNLERMFVESVQTFLTAPEISRRSSEEELDQCSRSLVLIMRSIPFCRYSFCQSACLSYMVECLINHLFGLASCLSENRQRVSALGSRGMASCFWGLVFYALLDLQQDPLASSANRIRFLRRFFVLYDRYFVRRRPFSQEERDAED